MVDSTTSDRDTDEQDATEGLPELARIRARSYHLSMGVPESQARAGGMRDLGYANSEVADALGVGDGTASGYYSKFGQRTSEAMTLALSTFGGPKDIRGWQMIEDSDDTQEWWFAAKPLTASDDETVESLYTPDSAAYSPTVDPDTVEEVKYRQGRAFPPEGEFALIKVRGTPTSFEAESERYESLDAMADDIYRDAEFDDLDTAQEVRGILSEAGLPEDALVDAREKV